MSLMLKRPRRVEGSPYWSRRVAGKIVEVRSAKTNNLGLGLGSLHRAQAQVGREGMQQPEKVERGARSSTKSISGGLGRQMAGEDDFGRN